MNTNKPAASTTTSSGSSNNKSFKKRFDKLIHYYGDHLPAEVDYVMVNLLTKDTLDFTENYNDGDKVRFNISINPATEAWTLKYYVNGELIDKHSDKGWPELLNLLRVGYIDEIPVNGTPEYNSLLTEWVEMKNNSSSTGYKKRFEKLIKYHIDHASSELESITTKNIKEAGFHLGEHYNTGLSEFDRSIVVSFIKNTNEFIISIFVDGKEVRSTQVKGYDNCVAVLEAYMYLPNRGTQDYNDLLVESASSVADDFKLYENLWD